MTGKRGAAETDGFQQSVNRRSVIRVMIGRSANGVGAPVRLYLSKSEYKSPMAVLFLGSNAVNREKERDEYHYFLPQNS